MPRVSTVVPTWNRWPMLGRAVSSALRQPETLEVIVVDDGSTDGSADELERLQDSRVRVVREDHTGNVARLRNAGASRARGEWLAFLDSDDYWTDDKLHCQLRALETTGLDWSFTAGRFVDENEAPVAEGYQYPTLRPGSDLLTELLAYRVAAPMPSLVVRRSVFAGIGGCDPAFLHDDFDLVFRLAMRGAAAAVAEPLLVITKDSARPSTPELSLRHHVEMLAVIVKLKERAPTELLSLVHDRCAFHLVRIARAHRRLGAPHRAVNPLLHAGIHALASGMPFPVRRSPCRCAPRRTPPSPGP